MELHLPFSDPELPIEVEEPSVLEYAREQGICVDYTTELPQLVDLCLSLQDTVDQDFRDPFDDDITNIVTAANDLLKQRLALPKDAAILLRSVLTMSDPPLNRPSATDDLQRIRGMKQELPILQTDADLDMLSFGTKFEPDFRELRARLPSEDLDEENDEGFEWPTKYFAYPAKCDAKIKSEKLTVTKDAMTILQSALCDDFTPKDNEKTIIEALESRRGLVSRYLTPPLMPLSSPSTPYIPSSPANRLPLIPESSDSVAAEAKALEQKIMAKDSLLRLHSGSSDSMLLDVANLDALLDADAAPSSHSSDHMPRILKRKVDDLKVEGPLTPPMFSDSPMKKLKSVSFSRMIQVGDSLELWPDDRRPRTSGSESTMDELFKEIEPIAKEAKRKAENEKLSGADTKARVEIPVLDFTLPVAPWDEFSQRKDGNGRSRTTELEAQGRFLQRIKRDDLKAATSWRGVSDLDLRWGWFASSSSAIMTLHEKLHGEAEFKKIQAELRTGDIARSWNEVWKRDGFRVLDEDEDEEEEEIEYADFEERSDMDTLIRQRKLELEEQRELMEAQHGRKEVAPAHPGLDPHYEPQPKSGGSPYSRYGPSISSNPGKSYQTSVDRHSQQSRSLSRYQKFAGEFEKASSELMFGGFSAATALQRFMKTQGKVIESVGHNLQANAAPDRIVQNTLLGDRESPSKSGLLVAQELPHIVQFQPRPIPEATLPFNLPASTFVISSALLQRRTLVKEVERLYPNAELVFRDYSLPHAAHADADVIISPSTGVLLTNLQQIKQMPLPGQTARSPVKVRMAMLQERYERLVVLVSEGLREEIGYSRPEDARDKETLAGLEVFAAQLEGDVTVMFILGGEQALARAIVEGMQKYGLPVGGKDLGDIKLLPVETTWEVFLCRAGFNPYAAQFIIASLKTSTLVALPLHLISPAKYKPKRAVKATGLSMFLLMEREDRAKLFQAVMGGRRILDRVSGLLDQRWLSAAHGFRM